MCEWIDKNWVRTWDETKNGKYPPSIHHANCREYRQIRYVRVFLDDCNPLIITPQELSTMEFGEDDYYITDVYMTKDQFEKIPEFQGF